MFTLYKKFYRTLPIFGPRKFLFKGERAYLYSKVFYSRTNKLDGRIRIILFIFTPLIWTFKSIVLIIKALKRNGRRIKAIQGVSFRNQLFSLLHLAFLKNLPPYYYYYLQLYRRPYDIGEDYLVNRHYIPIYAGLLGNKTSAKAIHDKTEFTNRLRKHVQGIPENKLVFSSRNVHELINLCESNKSDLFLKPVSGSSGENCFLLKYVPNSHPIIQTSLGLQFPVFQNEILNTFITNQNFIAQERYRNHHSINQLSNGHLCTSRITTYFTQNKEISVLFAEFLMPTGTGVTSNGSKGGIVSAVDITTGKINGAIRSQKPFETITVHPDGHGIIPGTTIPFWSEGIGTCMKAHQFFQDIPFIGWDVAFTTDGIKLLEGNLAWSVELWQLTHKETFNADSFISILTWHVKKHFKEIKRK